MLKKTFLGLSVILVAVLGVGFFNEYFAYHTYYTSMLESRQNRRTVLSGFIFALIPVSYMIFQKRTTFQGYCIALLSGLFLFSASYIAMKGDMFGFAAYLKLLFNTVLIMGLVVYMLTVFMTLGGRIKERFLALKTHDIFGLMLNLGIGLVVFLLVNYVLILANVSYSIVNRALFIAAGWFVYTQRNTLEKYRGILQSVLDQCKVENAGHAWRLLIALPFLPSVFFSLASFFSDAAVTFGDGIAALLGVLFAGVYLHKAIRAKNAGFKELFAGNGIFSVITYFLLLLTLRYIFNGFILAFIPYPTAWDANHAYMFFPKMRALNNGVYRNEIQINTVPQLRYTYITYRFSLFMPLAGFLGVSADTIAIEMNARSSLLVVFFGIALIAEVVLYAKKTFSHREGGDAVGVWEKGAILLGRFLLLQRLMSGMGMFLAFIDNKTDLGIMALIILAIYSGFVFLRVVDDPEGSPKEAKTYALLSGGFYAIAVLSKITALFDVVNFFLFMRWIRIGFVGAFGVFLLALGVLAIMQYSGMKEYLPVSIGKQLAAVGAIGFGFGVFRVFFSKLRTYGRYILLWGISFVVVILLCRVPFLIAETTLYKMEVTPGGFVQRIFLGHHDTVKPDLLLAQADGTQPMPRAQCSLETQGFSKPEALYSNLEKPLGDTYNEDVGRYVGFGRKGNPSDKARGIQPFVDPWRALFLQEGCQGFNPLFLSTADAVVLCNTEQQWKSLNVEQLSAVQTQLSPQGEAFELVQALRDGVEGSTDGVDVLRTRLTTELQSIEAYMQDSTIKVVSSAAGKEVYVPYRFITVFNVSFNRSLQNLSSYYTDIGVVRLMLFIFVIVGTIYGIIRRNRVLTALSGVTLFGWFLRSLVGGSILRYAIGLIVRTILAFVLYVYVLCVEHSDDEELSPFVPLVKTLFIGGFVVFGLVQMSLNLVRIASQGGGGAFMRYKTNVGVEEVFDDALQRTATPSAGFGSDEIFSLQFPHYNKLIALANTRSEDQGILIAGTYARYFINNQKYVYSDQFLTHLGERISDSNVCNAYLRLQDKKIKYMAIDPNIGTVVQGEGNKSLFNRFFGLITPSGTIEKDGNFTMLAKLYQGGYLKYVSSNNLGAKYAFTMPDSVFSGISGDELTVFRARMAIARFFSGDPQLFQTILQLAQQRLTDGTFVTDLADILGATIRENILVELARKPQLVPEDITQLTDDERRVFSQFLYLKQLDAANQQQTLTQLVSQSIGAGNQIIVLEVVE